MSVVIALDWNRSQGATTKQVTADVARLSMLASLAFFFLWGAIGAFGFKHIEYIATVPLVLVLEALVIVPIAADLKEGAARAPRLSACLRLRFPSSKVDQ